MTTPNLVIPKWWPQSLRSWFEQELSKADLDKNDRARLVRLIKDPRMRTVALRLAKEEKPALARDQNPYPLVYFMWQVWHAPANWEWLKQNPPSSRRKELSKFKQACDRFCNLLQTNEFLATWLISSSTNDKGLHHQGDPTEVFLELIDTIQKMSVAAGGEDNYYQELVDIDWTLPRKMSYRNAQEVFCIQNLAGHATELIGKPLYKEVAIIVTVLLGLDEEVSWERVKEIWKSRISKGGDSEEPF